MDGPRFDAITRTFSTTPSRRVLTGLVGALLAAPLSRTSAQGCKEAG